MVILKNKKIKICAGGVALVLLALPVFQLMTVREDVRAVSWACQQSSECMAAVAKEEEANKKAASASNSASAYERKVNELTAQIATKEAEIAQTTAEISDLKKQIAETEEKLEDEQEALAELLVNMHFESDAEPIKVLAGSTSISDLAEKAAREEVAKGQISAAAAAIKETKLSLEKDKEEVEGLLAVQQAAKTELASQQSEQKTLKEKYENDAAAYEEVAAAARAEQQAAAKAYQEAHPELFGGTGGNSPYAGAYNTYPWQNNCPGEWDAYITYWDGRAIGGYVCECVSYASWKVYERYGIAPAWGNAYDWDNVARNLGYRVDNQPEAGSVGQADGGTYGHVFWVESVNSDGSVNATEYNNAYATQLYLGSFHYGDFGSRVIPAGEAMTYNYIHF